MNEKKNDKFFRSIGITGLILLLIFLIWAQNRTTGLAPDNIKTSSSDFENSQHETTDKNKEHDHSNPAQHGDVKGKKLKTDDNKLKPSGSIVNGKRVVAYEAFKFGFSPDPLVVRSGEIVVLNVKSRDVKHGMMIPEIDFNAEIPANKVKTVSFKAPQKPGKYPVFCSVFCGSGHGDMRGVLVVLPAAKKEHH